MRAGSALPVADGRATLRAIGAALRPHRTGTVLALVTMIAACAVGLVAPAVLGRIVDLVADGRGADAITGPVLVLVAAVAVQGALTALGGALVARLGERVLATLRERVVDRALRLPHETVERAGTGDLLARVGDDVAVIATAVRSYLPLFVISALTIALTVVGLAALDWRLALAGLLATPVQAISVRRYARRSPPGFAAHRAATSRRSQQLVETIEGARTVRAFGLADVHVRRVDARAVEANALAMTTLRMATTFWTRLNYAELTGLAAVLVTGFLLVRDGQITVGDATAAALYFQRLFDPMGAVLGTVSEVQSALASLARLVGVTELEAVDPPPPAPGDGRVRLDGVRHRYADGPEVLHGVDLEVAPRERVALVGASGAGKTTVAKLVAGLHEPAVGSVEVGGPVRLVTQEVHVFAGTLTEDLRLAAPDATDAELEAALERVGALGWARALPDRLATHVGEGGVRLTPTQAQQLALARLVLADPAVAVLDEATAEAGSAGARVLEAAADAALDGRTALVVAHRLTQAAGADRVVVLDEGRVAEQGRHDELVAAGGAYGRLWRAWSAGRR